MLEVRNLSAGYNHIRVLNAVNIKVNPGEVIAIIGPNGCGKTTLLKSIIGLCSIFSGKISFNCKEIVGLPTHILARMGIGYVPQGRIIFNNMTVYENLEMGGYIIKDANSVNKKIEELCNKFLFLKEKKNDSASVLSGGQQQILSLARTLMSNPSLLLMDEPSLGLSPFMIEELFREIFNLRRAGVTVLLVEQNIAQALDIADRVYIMISGKTVFEKSPNEISLDDLRKMYFFKKCAC